MPWAVWETYDDEVLHVVPVMPDGEVQSPHKLDKQCVCEPHFDNKNPRILIHEQIQ